MIYVEQNGIVYQTNNRELAKLLGEYQEIGEDSGGRLHFDFGGVLISRMEIIDISLNGSRYTFPAHHLKPLSAALHVGRQEQELPYVKFSGYPFSYLISREDAEGLLHNIAQNYNEYLALSYVNDHLYQQALEAIADLPGVDVRREVATLKQEVQ